MTVYWNTIDDFYHVAGAVWVAGGSTSVSGGSITVAGGDVGFDTTDGGFNALLSAAEQDGREVQIVPTCDATAVAQYDVLAATEVITNAARAADIPVLLRSLKVLRLDSTTGVDLRVWLLKANVSVGAENAAFAPADADAVHLVGYVDLVAADFIGTTGMVNCFAQKTGLALRGIPATGTRDLYFAIQAVGAAGVDLGAATDLVLTFDFV